MAACFVAKHRWRFTCLGSKVTHCTYASYRAAAEAAKADPVPILRALAAELWRGQAAGSPQESPTESPPLATAATAFLGCKATVVRLLLPAARLRGGGAAAGSSVSHDDKAAGDIPQQPPAVDIPSAAASDALAACTAKRLAMQVRIHRRAATKQKRNGAAPPLLLLTLRCAP
jgi:hypothetical protein